jgi:5-methyltetrahydrofolate--homocysteine methyltransferase
MLEAIRQAVVSGDYRTAREETAGALSRGVKAATILDEALIPAMDVVGSEYERGVRYIPEMLVSAKAMRAAMEELRPQLSRAGVHARGKVVIGTVDGDVHDIGKNLVAMMLEGAGFNVVDLGTEVSTDGFMEAVRLHCPEVLAMSALLTTTMVHMPEVMASLEREGLRGCVKVIVGGAPITEDFARGIGADGYAKDAAAAVDLVRRLLGASPLEGQ